MTIASIGFESGDFGDIINFSCLQGKVYTTYADLVGCFGEPQGAFDDYKQTCCWDIKFADGVVATIYDWKTGMSTPPQEPYNWHIGGFSGTGVVSRVQECLDAYLQKVCQIG